MGYDACIGKETCFKMKRDNIPLALKKLKENFCSHEFGLSDYDFDDMFNELNYGVKYMTLNGLQITEGRMKYNETIR